MSKKLVKVLVRVFEDGDYRGWGREGTGLEERKEMVSRTRKGGDGGYQDYELEAYLDIPGKKIVQVTGIRAVELASSGNEKEGRIDEV